MADRGLTCPETGQNDTPGDGCTSVGWLRYANNVALGSAIHEGSDRRANRHPTHSCNGTSATAASQARRTLDNKRRRNARPSMGRAPRPAGKIHPTMHLEADGQRERRERKRRGIPETGRAGRGGPTPASSDMSMNGQDAGTLAKQGRPSEAMRRAKEQHSHLDAISAPIPATLKARQAPSRWWPPATEHGWMVAKTTAITYRRTGSDLRVLRALIPKGVRGRTRSYQRRVWNP